jgi:hypothetical protein
MVCGLSQSCGLAQNLPLQVTVQNYEKFVNWQRKLPENLEVTGKMLIFAASNTKFDYPVNIRSLKQRIPRGASLYRHYPLKRVACAALLS